MPKAGIAIIAYKRPDYLDRCLASISSLTPGPYELVVLCDADDDDESKAVCRARGVDAVFGANRGVVWNKNRGLFHFMSRTSCDPIIMLEDDACPTETGWLNKWVEAAARWDHVNFSYSKLFASEGLPPSGEGTPEHPHVNSVVSGQCTVVSRHAMQTGGYLDTRFKGYGHGHGHVEWSRRHASLLYKDRVEGFSDDNILFLSIDGGISAGDAPTFRNEVDVTRNHELLRRTMSRTPQYLEPWQSASEKKILLAEIAAAAASHPAEDTVAPGLTPTYRGHVDYLSGRHDRFVVTGWAARGDGAPVSNFLLKIGDRTIVDKIVDRVNRHDVVQVHPDARLDCGFELTFDLSEEETEAFRGHEMTVTPMEAGVAGECLRLRQPVVWPPPGWQPVSDAPTMPAAGALRLDELLRGSRCYLEYGAGGSTVKACELGVPVVISVESDRDWHDALVRKIATRPSASQLIPLHIDLGPVKDWGFPVSEAHWKNYSNYPLRAWEECIRRGLKPDLVLIDGRFRVACFMATLLFAQPGCRILFDDYGDRPDCKVVERFVQPLAMAGRVAEFVVAGDLPRDDAWLAFVQACTDVG